MIEGSFSLAKSTSGRKSMGEASSSTLHLRSESIVRCILRPQWAQEVSTFTLSFSFLKCPCTKGVATASMLQAA